MALIKVIKNTKNNNVLAWKYPDDELNTLSQLIVQENEEAVLFKDGQALDIFKAGKYTLDTPNIPILNKIVNLPFGGESPFKAQVWFINKIYTLDIKWGTRTPIQIQDPKYEIIVPVRAFGEFGIRIEDSKKFLIKLVGKVNEFDVENLKSYFRGLYLTKVKDSISSYLVKRQISITEINAYIDELSEYTKERITPVFEEYGIKVASFYINDISVSEDDSAIKTLKEALTKKAEMKLVGFNYKEERSFDAIDKLTENKKGFNIANLGMNIAAGINVGRNLGNEVSKVTENISSQSIKYCHECGNKLNGNEAFCPNCGTKLANVCSKCGNHIDAGYKFCPVCGNNLKEGN